MPATALTFLLLTAKKITRGKQIYCAMFAFAEWLIIMKRITQLLHLHRALFHMEFVNTWLFFVIKEASRHRIND